MDLKEILLDVIDYYQQEYIDNVIENQDIQDKVNAYGRHRVDIDIQSNPEDNEYLESLSDLIRNLDFQQTNHFYNFLESSLKMKIVDYKEKFINMSPDERENLQMILVEKFNQYVSEHYDQDMLEFEEDLLQEGKFGDIFNIL